MLLVEFFFISPFCHHFIENVHFIEMFYSFSLFMSLNICVNFRAQLSVNTYTWDNRSLPNVTHCAHWKICLFIIVAMSYIQKLNSIKHFINIFNIEFYGFSLFLNNISHCFTAIYSSGWHFNTINLIIYYGLTWDL